MAQQDLEQYLSFVAVRLRSISRAIREERAASTIASETGDPPSLPEDTAEPLCYYAYFYDPNAEYGLRPTSISGPDSNTVMVEAVKLFPGKTIHVLPHNLDA